jgi:beta-lactamase superfamily II metal-dependent hydrolase
MGIFHFLNVKDGDCSVIEHPSGHVTVIDVCNASSSTVGDILVAMQKALDEEKAVSGNFKQKEYPVNPISYLKARGITSVFRFVLTHPEMDHMDGMKDFFTEFKPTNFWDTGNTCVKDFGEGSRYDENDWAFYQSIRNRNSANEDPKRLLLHASDCGKYWNQYEDGSAGGDGLHILAPTPALITNANQTENWNDCSYVILYRSAAGRILLAGDSHDATWEHILENHRADVENVELLIAPHHGRKSGRSYEFLDVVKPKVTLFGNAPSEHLAYDAWNNRNLHFITNNQANCVIVDTNGAEMQVYVTNESYARECSSGTTYSAAHGGWHIGYIPSAPKVAA